MSLRINRSALVMFSAQQMYELINDVRSYPEFLPWCASATLLEDDGINMRASLEVSKGGMRQSFTTNNSLKAHEKISMTLVEGPFRKLKGDWNFIALREDACKVELDLEFELKQGVAKLAFGPVFNQAANTMVDAFCERAKVVYGVSIGK
jgi:ribosome-associated toxin RatA of RatAB toxin-antitoxin module